MDKVILIGHPIGHSKSPTLHQAVFDAMGLSWSFELSDVPEERAAERFIGNGDFIGLSVTTPYKPLAARMANISAASARLVGGANAVANRRGVLMACNYDGQGAVSFMEHRGIDFGGKTVAVCGTGPTALSCLHAAAQVGANCVILLGRDKERARRVLQGYLDRYRNLAYASINPPADGGKRSFREALDQVKYLFGAYESSPEALQAADIIIDATTLGMKEGDPAPFDTGLLHAGQTVLDTCCLRKTAVLQAAENAGCRCFDGAGMLLNQGMLAEDLWFEMQEIECPLSWDERLALMADAGGFTV